MSLIQIIKSKGPNLLLSASAQLLRFQYNRYQHSALVGLICALFHHDRGCFNELCGWNRYVDTYFASVGSKVITSRKYIKNI